MDGDDAIAIVGIGCRFPGANNIDEFWQVLVNGENHLIEIPEDRWNSAAFYDPGRDTPGKSYVKQAAFVQHHDAWDNRFFMINDAEAERMDPQQAMVLECVYMALENAGITREDIFGSTTGVYLGIMNSDYSALVNADLVEINHHAPTGSSNSIAANRVSFTFNLQGPSLCVDTACSSAMVALHLAAQALRTGECTMAIAGGCNLIMTPENFVPLCRAKMMSAKGQCQAFCADADGYARGEGCGMVIMKRLKDALHDHDHIWAVVGTALNQDGHTAVPISAPSASQQETLLKHIYGKYQVDPAELQYAEAHGTGTPIGDPIEVNALGKVLGKSRKEDDLPLFVGSVKTNIGHLESAAGCAGLIKVLLMMRAGKIAPSLHYTPERGNPKINFDEIRMKVPTEVTDWPPSPKGYRMCCVNSFGFGGTNGHAIVREHLNEKPEHGDDRTYIVAVSGTSEGSTQGTLTHLVERLRTGQYTLNEVAYTSTCRRTHYNFRVAKAASSMEEMIEKLEAASNYPPSSPTVDGNDKKIIFVFCGMGTHWEGMCLDLYAKEPIFRQKMDEIDQYLFELSGWSVMQKFRDHEGFDQPDIAQPMIFACQVAQAELWMHWGIKPAAIVGHSVGEVAAACVAGALPIKEAVTVIYHRGRLQKMVTGGKMLVAGKIPVEEVEELCKKYPGQVNIAAYNSATSCTVSGDDDAIDELHRELQSKSAERSEKLFLRELKVSSAFHSHHMEPIVAPLIESLAEIKGSDIKIPIASTVTGDMGSERDFVTGDYWSRNVRQAVMFQQAIEKVVSETDTNVFIEIGPRPALRANIAETAGSAAHVSFPTTKPKNEHPCMLETLCQLYQTGVDPSWSSYYKGLEVPPADVPKYHFNRSKTLFIPEKARLNLQGGGTGGGTHPFLGSLPGTDTEFKVVISKETTPFLYDHTVGGTIVVPGVFHIEVGYAAYMTMTQFRFPTDHIRLSVEFVSPIVLTSDDPVNLRVVLEVVKPEGQPQDGQIIEQYKYKVTSRNGHAVHATGTITVNEYTEVLKKIDMDGVRERCLVKTTSQDIYGMLSDYGFDYGPSFRGLGSGVRNTEEYLAKIRIPDVLLEDVYTTIMHPALIDIMQQAGGMLAAMEKDRALAEADTSDTGNQEEYGQVLPRGLGSIIVRHPPKRECWAYVRKLYFTREEVKYNVCMVDDNGDVLVEIRNSVAKAVTQYKSVEDVLTYTEKWRHFSLAEDKKMNSSDESLNDVDVEADPGMERQDSRSSDSNVSLSPVARPKALVFCDKENAWQAIKDHVATDSIFFQPDSCPAAVLLHDEETMAKLLKERVSDDALSTVEVIIHMWSYQNHQLSFSPEVIDFAIQYGSASLRQLVKALVTSEMNIPILVLTQGTQIMNAVNGIPSELKKFENSIPNPIGSQVRGFTRCLLKEFTYNHIKVIDLLHGNETEISKFGSVLNKILQENVCEMMISDKSIYWNEFVQHSDDKNAVHRRENIVYPGCEVRLVSASNNAYRNLHCRYDTKQRTEKIPASGMVKLTVDTALIHPEPFFPVTIDGMTNKEKVWSKDDIEGHDVISLSMTGEVQAIGNQKKSKFQVSESVVTLYPTSVHSSVIVPEWCLLKLPPYKEHLKHFLPQIMISWYILKKIRLHKRPVTVISRSTQSMMTHTVCMMGSAEHRPTFILHPSDLTESKIADPEPFIVLLTALDIRETEALSRAIQGSATIVILQEWAKPGYKLDLSHAVPEAIVHSVSLREFFTPVNLKQHHDKFAKWLEKTTKLSKLGFKVEPLELSAKEVRSTSKTPSHNLTCDSKTVCVFSIRKDGVQVPLPVQTGKGELFRPDCSYMVIGGLTGLGWEIVRFMAERGAGYILPVSRRQPSEEMVYEISELEDTYKSKVVCLQADVSDMTSLRNAFNDMATKLPGVHLKGVFHGGAVLDDGLLVKMTQEQFQRVTNPKIVGTLNLHVLTKDMDLDYFVMHSSTASSLGNAGQTNYAAGNSFMDTFAHYRRQLNLAGQTINWTALSIGMLKDNEALRKKLANQGWPALDVPDILRCFEHCLCTNHTQITFGEFNWKRITQDLMKGDFSHIRSRFKTLIALNYVERSGGEGGRGQLLQINIDELLKMAPEKRQPIIFKYLKLLLSEIFSMEPSFVKDDSVLMELGMDSMLAMTLISKLNEDLKVKVPVVIIIGQDTTPLTLTNYLNEHLGAGEAEDSGEVELTEKSFDDQIPSICPTEYTYWMKYLEDPSDYSVLNVVGFRNTMRIWDLYFMREVLDDMHKRLPALRTTYRSNDRARYGVEAVTHDAKTFKPPYFMYEVNNVYECEARLAECIKTPWNFEKESGLRVVILKKRIDVKYFAFIFHHMVFDMTAINAVLNEFPTVTVAKMEAKKSPRPSLTSSGHQVALAMDSFLARQSKTLSAFWKGLCPEDVPLRVRLPSSLPPTDHISKHGSYILRHFSESTWEKITTFVKDNNLTLFKLFMSAYQLLLHQYCKSHYITVGGVVDLRSHLKDVKNPMTSFANHIPYVASFKEEDCSILEFLRNNAEIINQCIEHSVYPAHRIHEDIRGSPTFPYPHLLVMKDAGDFSPVFESASRFGTHIYRVQQVGCWWETRMALWKNVPSEPYHIELSYSYDILTRSEANAVAGDYVSLLEAIVDCPEMSLSEISRPKLFETITDAIEPYEQNQAGPDGVLYKLKTQKPIPVQNTAVGSPVGSSFDKKGARALPPPYSVHDQHSQKTKSRMAEKIRKKEAKKLMKSQKEGKMADKSGKKQNDQNHGKDAVKTKGMGKISTLNKDEYSAGMKKLKEYYSQMKFDIATTQEIRAILSSMPYSPNVLKLQGGGHLSKQVDGKLSPVHMRLLLPGKAKELPKGIRLVWGPRENLYRSSLKLNKIISADFATDGENSGMVIDVGRKKYYFVHSDAYSVERWVYGIQELLDPDDDAEWD